MNIEQIRQVRSFNRLVTQRVGTLEDSYLSRGRPFGEARLIFEIGKHDRPDLRLLRSRLGLDSGYLSRLLRSLEGQGLVEVSQNADDGRVRRLALTARGRDVVENSRQARSRLEHHLSQLVGADDLGAARRVLTALLEIVGGGEDVRGRSVRPAAP